VIIYDQIEAPVLWIEENEDKSEHGRSRIIPGEYVGAIFEVKAAFNRASISDATKKLADLAPLTKQIDDPSSRYLMYLPRNLVLGIVCFELRKSDASDESLLESIRDFTSDRHFYGTLILRGDGINSDGSALVQQLVCEQPLSSGIFTENGLLHQTALSTSKEFDNIHKSALLMWADIQFERFAFDLLALLRGTYKSGFSSSFHGLDLSNLKPSSQN
jgi:hypothetical protein